MPRRRQTLAGPPAWLVKPSRSSGRQRLLLPIPKASPSAGGRGSGSNDSSATLSANATSTSFLRQCASGGGADTASLEAKLESIRADRDRRTERIANLQRQVSQGRGKHRVPAAGVAKQEAAHEEQREALADSWQSAVSGAESELKALKQEDRILETEFEALQTGVGNEIEQARVSVQQGEQRLAVAESRSRWSLRPGTTVAVIGRDPRPACDRAAPHHRRKARQYRRPRRPTRTQRRIPHELAVRFMRECAKEFQILVLTCHPEHYRPPDGRPLRSIDLSRRVERTRPQHLNGRRKRRPCHGSVLFCLITGSSSRSICRKSGPCNDLFHSVLFCLSPAH